MNFDIQSIFKLKQEITVIKISRFENSRSPFSHDRPHNFRAHQLPHHLFLPPLPCPLRPYCDPHVKTRDGQNTATNPPRHLTNVQRAENDPRGRKLVYYSTNRILLITCSAPSSTPSAHIQRKGDFRPPWPSLASKHETEGLFIHHHPLDSHFDVRGGFSTSLTLTRIETWWRGTTLHFYTVRTEVTVDSSLHLNIYIKLFEKFNNMLWGNFVKFNCSECFETVLFFLECG